MQYHIILLLAAIFLKYLYIYFIGNDELQEVISKAVNLPVKNIAYAKVNIIEIKLSSY